MFAVSPLSAQTQLPQTRLFTVFPPGAKTGSAIEAAITGGDLDEVDRMTFTHAGITAAQKKTGDQPVANTFVVNVAANVPPGVYEARIIGRFGISNPRAFVVGALAEVNEATTNATFAGAMPLALNSTVNGRADASNSDHYRFSAKKGQRMLVQCDARSIDSRMDAVLVLLDASGRELDRARRGGLIDFTAPADMDLVVKTHDFTFGGGAEHFYRLTVSTGPWIEFVFPPCGQPGTKTKFTLYGRNLPGSSPANVKSADGKPLEKLAVDIDVPGDPATRLRLAGGSQFRPEDAAVDGFEYRITTPQGVSNPALITFATAPVVAEVEPNSKPAQAQKVTLPAEICGQFYPARDEDWFAFEAKKGDAFWVEVLSARLGLPTDPFLVIQRVTKNDKGEETATDVLELADQDTNISGSPDFNTATRDPAGRFEAKDDGTYRVVVRDLFNRTTSAPRFVYRLAIRKEAPDFRLVALPASPMPKKDTKNIDYSKPLLRRGETQPIRVIAFRRDNFGGDITVTAEGLPPGVTASTATIAGGRNVGTLLLTASEAANAFTGPLKITGKAKVGDAELAREARGASVIWTLADPANEAVFSRLARETVLSVSAVESAPVVVNPAQDKVFEHSVSAKMEIPLAVMRRGDFTQNLSLKPTGLTQLDPMPAITVDGKATNATLTLDLAQFKLPVGEHTFYLVSQTQGKYRNNPEGAKAADDAAKAMEKSATDLAAAAKKAAEALAAATKAQTDADAAAKTATEKAAQAKTAAEKAAADQNLAKAAVEAAKAADDAKAKAKAAADAKAAAQKASEEAAAKQKAAETQRDQLKAKATAAATVATPKDVLASVYSPPIRLKLAPAPITLELGTPSGQVSQGAKLEVPVKITRLFGYADPVEVVLTVPGAVKGVQAAKVTIAKDATTAKLELAAAADATAGDHKLTVQAQLKLNNQNLTVDQPLALKLLEVPKAKK
jgi:murein DD-endopeptidase MepM/ murein hydrolase activator NlpD